MHTYRLGSFIYIIIIFIFVPYFEMMNIFTQLTS